LLWKRSHKLIQFSFLRIVILAMPKILRQNKELFQKVKSWFFILWIFLKRKQCVDNQSNYLPINHPWEYISKLIANITKVSFDPIVNLLVNELHVITQIKVSVILSNLGQKCEHDLCKNSTRWSAFPERHKRPEPYSDLLCCCVLLYWKQSAEHDDPHLRNFSVWIQKGGEKFPKLSCDPWFELQFKFENYLTKHFKHIVSSIEIRGAVKVVCLCTIKQRVNEVVNVLPVELNIYLWFLASQEIAQKVK